MSLAPSPRADSCSSVALQTIFSHRKRNCTNFFESAPEEPHRMLYQSYQMQDDLIAPLR